MYSKYVWPFGPFVWLTIKNHTASSSCAKSLPFRFHILGHNFNTYFHLMYCTALLSTMPNMEGRPNKRCCKKRLCYFPVTSDWNGTSFLEAQDWNMANGMKWKEWHEWKGKEWNGRMNAGYGGSNVLEVQMGVAVQRKLPAQHPKTTKAG